MGYGKVHAYAASFGENLAKELITKYTNRKETILDPFMGAGTAIFQACLLDREAIGIDTDPIACLIVKTIGAKYEDGDIDRIDNYITDRLSALEYGLYLIKIDEKNLEAGSEFSVDGLKCQVPNNDKIEYWFAPVQRALLAALLGIVEQIEDPKLVDVVKLTISSAIIRKWPNTLSLARDIDHSRPHRTERSDLSIEGQVAIFKRVWKNVIRIIREQNSINKKSESGIKVIEGDVCEKLEEIEEESIDYVLTSPPYFNAIDYPRAHRYSQWWLWAEEEALRREKYIGLRSGGKINNNEYIKKCSSIVPNRMKELEWLTKSGESKYISLCRYISDLNDVIDGLRKVIKKDKYLTFILANNKINGIEIPLSEIVIDLIVQEDFNCVEVERRQITANRRRYPYGIAGFKGLMENEYIISARKAVKNG